MFQMRHAGLTIRQEVMSLRFPKYEGLRPATFEPRTNNPFPLLIPLWRRIGEKMASKLACIKRHAEAG